MIKFWPQQTWASNTVDSPFTNPIAVDATIFSGL
jgi:hypothetical protein